MENELVDLVMEDTRERMVRAIEHVKSELLQGLNDRSIKGKPCRLLQLAFDYLSGR